MIKVVFPASSFQIKEMDAREMIFDEIRKSWVKLTPEEWVRQNFVQYIVQVMNYPAALIGIEKEMKLGELRKRFDLLVYNKEHQPWMMIECKAMDVELSEKTVEQIIRYHMSVPVPYIVITNGSYTYAWKKKEGRFVSLSNLPDPE